MNPPAERDGYRSFYEHEYHRVVTAGGGRPEDHPFSPVLRDFIGRFGLSGKKVLEIGSGTGLFQDAVPDYTGLDIVASLAAHYHKPFHTVKAGEPYPFPDGTFDALWSYAVFEHVPDIEHELSESLRVLAPGGVFLFSPAWQVRPWAAGGYAAKSYGDLSLRGKLIKFSILWRDTVLWRAIPTLLRRTQLALRRAFARGAPSPLVYRKLEPNYEKFLVPDSDACNSIDPYAAILWFRSRGCEVLDYPTPLARFFVRTGPFVIRKPSEGGRAR